ncbi:MAG: hypothetical protein ACR2QF_04820 [Geminicoccaceae bacterium]
MTVKSCLNKKVKAGKLTRKQADAAIDLIEKFERGEAQTGAGAARAAAAAQKRMKQAAREQRRRAALVVARRAEIAKNIASHRKGPIAGALSHLVRDIFDAAPWGNVDRRKHAVLGQLHAKWAEGIERFRPKFVGAARETDALRSFLRSIYGETIDDPDIAKLAKHYGDSSEFARHKWTNAGGALSKRDDWRVPNPSHDYRTIRKTSKDDWVRYTFERVDRDKMRDLDTDLPLNDAELESVLNAVYDTLATNGLNKLKPGSRGMGNVLANRHNHKRVLHFKTADGWLEYNERFGSSDLFGTVMGHFDNMASDIGQLEILGPNPGAMVRWMVDTARKEVVDKGGRLRQQKLKTIEDTWGVLSGSINEGEGGPISNFFTGVRNYLPAAQLEGAFLSSISDIGFQKIATKMNGTSFVNTMANYTKLMNPANKEDRVFSAQMGLIAESAASVALGARRYDAETAVQTAGSRLTDTVLRASLLTPSTQAGRWAFGTEFLGMLARESGKKFDALDEAVQASFGRYGITGDDWDVIRKARTFDKDGSKFVYHHFVAENAPDVATKLLEMIQTETDFAVPSTDTLTRAIVTQGTNTNTFLGQVTRSLGLYKSFPITVMLTHLRRGLNQGDLGNMAQAVGIMAVRYSVMMTMMGAIAFQAKQIRSGKEPVPWDDPKLWGAAMLQGGGLGLAGDLLFSDVNRFGGGLPQTLAGPMAGLLDDTRRLTIGNALELAQGDDTNFARELVKFGARYAPGADLWYTGPAFQRLFLDQAELMLDPKKAKAGFKRKETNARREMGQKYWWAPGDAAPGF